MSDIQRPDWGPGGEVRNPVVPAEPAQSHEQLVADIAAYDGPTGAALYDQNHAPVPAKPKGFSGLPNWSDKPPRDAETGRFVAKSSNTALLASLGITPEVAEVLSATGDLAAAAGNLRSSMTRIWGDAAQDVATWGTELSPTVQAK